MFCGTSGFPGPGWEAILEVLKQNEVVVYRQALLGSVPYDNANRSLPIFFYKPGAGRDNSLPECRYILDYRCNLIFAIIHYSTLRKEFGAR